MAGPSAWGAANNLGQQCQSKQEIGAAFSCAMKSGTYLYTVRWCIESVHGGFLDRLMGGEGD